MNKLHIYCDWYLCPKHDCQYLANMRSKEPMPNVGGFVDPKDCGQDNFSSYLKKEK